MGFECLGCDLFGVSYDGFYKTDRDFFFLKVGLIPGGWDWQVRKIWSERMYTLGAGFKYFFIFTPMWESDPI